MQAIHAVIHVVLVALMPLLLPGVIAKTKAAFAGRVGPPVLQPYYDVIKLLQKGSVFSQTTTWVFLAGPAVGLATAMVASLLVPLGGHAAPVSFQGDLVLVAYLFALGRFFTASAALDTGSAFEGMGAAREVTFACLAEPALFLGFLVLAKLADSLSLTDMLDNSLAGKWSVGGGSLVLVAISLFVVLLAENCRVPFDDPNTHLELTMIHEVMVLDHSGPALGLVLYGAAVKMFVLSAVVVRIFAPISSGNAWLDWLLFGFAMVLLAVVVGIVESTMARLRLVNIPKVLVGACLIAAFGLILLLR